MASRSALTPSSVPIPISDLDDDLIKAIDEVGADLVVMPTHPPKHVDVIMPSHGGKVATHTKASVFLVRPEAGE